LESRGETSIGNETHMRLSNVKIEGFKAIKEGAGRPLKQGSNMRLESLHREPAKASRFLYVEKICCTKGEGDSRRYFIR